MGKKSPECRKTRSNWAERYTFTSALFFSEVIQSRQSILPDLYRAASSCRCGWSLPRRLGVSPVHTCPPLQPWGSWDAGGSRLRSLWSAQGSGCPAHPGCFCAPKMALPQALLLAKQRLWFYTHLYPQPEVRELQRVPGLVPPL